MNVPSSDNSDAMGAKPLAGTLSLVMLVVASFAAVWVCLGVAVYPCRVNDLWWQLRTGHDIAAMGRLPHTDAYSWTKFGARWDVIEWLAFLLEWFCFERFAGLFGVWLLTTLLLLALGAVCWVTLVRSTGKPLPALMVFLALMVGLAPNIQPRPQLYTYLLEAVLCVFVVRRARKITRFRQLIWVPPLFALWGNLHQGALVGVLILAAYGAGKALELAVLGRMTSIAPNAKRFTPVAVVVLAAAAAAVAVMASPYGDGIYRNVIVTLGSQSAMSRVNEWRPALFPLGAARTWARLAFFGLAGLYIVRKERCWGVSVTLIVLGYEAMAHVRNMPIFLIAAAMLAAVDLIAALPSGRVRSLKHASWWALGVGAALMAVTVAAVCRLNRGWNGHEATLSTLPAQLVHMSYAVDGYPADAVGFMEFEQFPSDMLFYNDYDLGGYLILFAPEHKVFTDGRNDVYVGTFLDHDLKIELSHGLDDDDRAFLASFPLDVVLTGNPAVAASYRRDPDWSLVYARYIDYLDSRRRNCWLFVRSEPKYAPLIARSRSDWARHNQGMLPTIL